MRESLNQSDRPSNPLTVHPITLIIVSQIIVSQVSQPKLATPPPTVESSITPSIELPIEVLQAQLANLQRQLTQETRHRQQVESSLRESQICLRILSSISKSTAAGLSAEAIIIHTLEQMGHYFNDRRITYAIIEQGILQEKSAISPSNLAFQRPAFRLNLNQTTHCGHLLHRRQAIIIEDVQQEPMLKPIAHDLRIQQIRSLLIMPLQVLPLQVLPLQQRPPTLGVLCFDMPHAHPWSPYEVATLAEIVDYLAVIIQEYLAQQDRQRAEAKIHASLKEKEVLLKEIHHRVKNNLQVVSSLLKLQSGHLKNAQENIQETTQEQQALNPIHRSIDAFKDSQNRVRAMALVHEKLYQSDDLARADFGSYVSSLVQDLLRSYRTSTEPVQIRSAIHEVYLSLDQAIPCGLIINELVSNALKYAFPAGAAGEIDIQLYPDGEDQYILIVQDNGVGFNRSDLLQDTLHQNLQHNLQHNLQQASTLGLQIVHSLTQQLGGTVFCESHRGTSFRITFADSSVQEKG